MKTLLIILTFLSFNLFAEESLAKGEWEKFYIVSGKCNVNFPKKPYHRSQVLPIYEANAYMKYDVYLSQIDEENSMCMMVVAEYPTEIDPAKEESSLESFLNGMISKKGNKRLINANFCEFEGCNAIDFYVEKDSRYFKGKALISKNKLYLLAIEHNTNIDMDEEFEKYMSSFKFSQE